MRVDMKATSIRPPEWDGLAAEVSEYTASIRWLETMGPLLPGELRWLVVSVDGQSQRWISRWAASRTPGRCRRGSSPASCWYALPYRHHV